MGRTISPYSEQMKRMEERLSNFRRALSKPDQEIFDALIRFAKLQPAAGVMASNPHPFDSMSMSMMVGLLKKIQTLEKELETLKQKQAD